MPSHGHSFLQRLHRKAALAAASGTLICAMPAPAAASSLLSDLMTRMAAIQGQEMILLTLTVGLTTFAVVTTLLLLHQGIRATRAEEKARAEIEVLKDEMDRLRSLLLADPQLVVNWGSAHEPPAFIGDVRQIGATGEPEQLLSFTGWLPEAQAQALGRAVEGLKQRGEGFRLYLTTLGGDHIEAIGRAVTGRAVLRLVNITGVRQEHAEALTRLERLNRDIRLLRGVLEAMPYPLWARDGDGRLVWVNPAYSRAVDQSAPAEVIRKAAELFDEPVRQAIQASRKENQPFSRNVPAIVSGQRRVLKVFDIPLATGSSGIAIDVTDADVLEKELRARVDANRRTLDRLPTAVAIFDRSQHLAFYNQAYRHLWSLDDTFLDTHPSDSAILDHLRAHRRLPEQSDFRAWRTQVQATYTSLEAKDHAWHLPDGRTIHVVSTPNPEGGVTYLFDDVTEKLALERRYDALIRVQGETLDNLEEAVAVFGSDGRLNLSNPAFRTMWRLPGEKLDARPHIEALVGLCRTLYPVQALWDDLRRHLTALDQRTPLAERLERTDGSVLELTTVPLPEGATLLTFRNITDSVNVEKALHERAEALEDAGRIRNDFVQHVSYELRSPLTSIIGFAQLLNEPAIGSLNTRQREYLDYIMGSSGSLLAIIDDILDLATIDAGTMSLDLQPVDIHQAVNQAVEGLRDRISGHHLDIRLEIDKNIGSFIADASRIRQILYNLLSNAIGFSPDQGTVTLNAARIGSSIVFRVKDEGPGIPPERLDRIFERFETQTGGSRHRGVGLGLSIVRAFVELHGGVVEIASVLGEGTTVTCRFPATARVGQEPAPSAKSA